MAFGKHRRIIRILGVVFILWIFSSCARDHPSLRPAAEKTPLPIEIKPGTPASKAKMPADMGTEADVVVPETPALEIPSQAPSTSGFYSHKVRWPNETLYLIARWYTGTARNWKAIAKANPELDPKKMAIGVMIAIPESLLISRKPMPFSFLHPLVREKAKPPARSEKISIPAEPQKLFGPIGSDKAGPFVPTDVKPPSRKSDAVKMFGPVE
jgi:hypothetical protein